MNTTYWFTGLPCSGKTTICKKVSKKWCSDWSRTVHLDGDVVRNGLCSDLTFTPEDRKENLRRIAHLCELLNQQGITVFASFVSPTESARDIVREIVSDLKIIYVDCSVEKCIERDVKGMYAKALKGEIPNFTGVSAPFDAPTNPDLTINTVLETADQSVQRFLDLYP
jgi:adenylylsulfate kinase